MRLRLILILTAMVLIATGCGGGGSSGGSTPAGGTPGSERADGANGQDDGPGAPGLPGNDNNGKARGSPIDIPTFASDPEIVRDQLIDDLTVKCGGTLCVEVVIEPRDRTKTKCQFVKIDPRPGSQVWPGDVVAVVTGTQPCTPESSESEGGDGDSTPEDQTSPEENTETSPEGDTTSPDAGSPG